ncbi:MAG: trypsin-like peptidase domain-containing protein [Candidatus Liptonbacteria bacterium]|nr:trypsin-like peptidase domain-containing protein [Candidatus Liptonbacteria bacterium]
MKKYTASFLVFLILVAGMPVARAQENTIAIENALISILRQVVALLLEQLQILQTQLAQELQKRQEIASEQPKKEELRPLSSQPIAFLSCFFTVKPGRESFASAQRIARGTGTVVHPEGYILTTRHLVDPGWAVAAYPNDANFKDFKDLSDNYAFQSCEVSSPDTETLPTREEIKFSNPKLPAAQARYNAVLHFLPPQRDVSAKEFNNLDFSILKINERINCAPGTTSCDLPNAYPHIAAQQEAPDVQTAVNVVSFGYPIEQIGGFGRSELEGIVGTLTKYFGGDELFYNKPLSFEWTADNARPGFSGSPILFENRIIGVELGASRDNPQTNYALGMPAIAEILNAHGLGNVLP